MIIIIVDHNTGIIDQNVLPVCTTSEMREWPNFNSGCLILSVSFFALFHLPFDIDMSSLGVVCENSLPMPNPSKNCR